MIIYYIMLVGGRILLDSSLALPPGAARQRAHLIGGGGSCLTL